jgi:hypothetical protein
MAVDVRSAHDRGMNTLHIDVQITDLAAWTEGYARHADTRRARGVRNAVVRHPVGDDSRLIIDLDFDTAAEATEFLSFLQEDVWRDQPILAAPPETSILEPLALG